MLKLLARSGQVLFTYLHLAADKRLTEELLARQVTAIAYETVQTRPARCPCWPPCPRSPAGSPQGRRRHS